MSMAEDIELCELWKRPVSNEEVVSKVVVSPGVVDNVAVLALLSRVEPRGVHVAAALPVPAAGSARGPRPRHAGRLHREYHKHLIQVIIY